MRNSVRPNANVRRPTQPSEENRMIRRDLTGEVNRNSERGNETSSSGRNRQTGSDGRNQPGMNQTTSVQSYSPQHAGMMRRLFNLPKRILDRLFVRSVRESINQAIGGFLRLVPSFQLPTRPSYIVVTLHTEIQNTIETPRRPLNFEKKFLISLTQHRCRLSRSSGRLKRGREPTQGTRPGHQISGEEEMRRVS